MATIKDVAITAGVAVGTVSRYLNGAMIKKINRIKVEKAIELLNYKMNPIAHCLKTNRTYTIGLVSPEIANPLISGMVRFIGKILYSYGYLIIPCSHENNSELEREMLEELTRRKIDGLIIFPVQEELSFANSNDIPVIVINPPISSGKIDSISCSFMLQINTAITQIIDSGCNNIVIVSSMHALDKAERTEQIRTAEKNIKDANPQITITCLDNIEETELASCVNRTSWKGSTTTFLCLDIDALRMLSKITGEASDASNNKTAVYALDIPTGYIFTAQTLISINQPVREISELTAYTMLKRINGDMTGYPSTYRLPPQILRVN